MKITAIIGFGFCGRLAFSHLAKNSQKNRKIIIFEKSKNGFGAAFSGFSPHYILNVPTNKMSAFSDQPRDFCEFLEKKYPQIWKEIGEQGFAPREIYGKYLDELTHQAFENAKKNGVEFEFVNEEVNNVMLSLSKHDSGREAKITLRQAQGDSEFEIKTKSEKSFQATEILLATSFTQSDLPFEIPAKNVVKKLWNEEALPFHQKKFIDEKICLIGSGLTAVDVIVGLKKKGFAGKIFVTSRRGNFPKKHFEKPQEIPNFISPDDARNGVLSLCLKIRNFLRKNPQFDLRHIIDSMRHITVDLWHNLDEKNKKLFLKLLPYWNIFRHRAPVSSIESIEKMIEAGQIEIHKKSAASLHCDWVVNCLGFEFRAQKYPLLRNMLENNLLKKDFFLAQSNHKNIHLLGGLNIGRDFECTSVPDLRVSVEQTLKSF